MKDIKVIIAKNLSFFRKQSGLTQAELAEKLNYSDKAVSRWEHGDTLPDINVLYQLCEFYGIDMNTLISEDADIPASEPKDLKNSMRFRVCLYGLAASFVWILATIIFIYTGLISGGNYFWLAFIWAIPLTCIALGIASFGLCLRVFRLVISSIFIWTLLTAVFLSFVYIGYPLWPVYLMGIPLQIICVMAFIIKKDRVGIR